MDELTSQPRMRWWAWVLVAVGAVVLGPLAPLVALTWGLVYIWEHPDPATRALFLKRTGFVLVVAAGSVFGLFAAREAGPVSAMVTFLAIATTAFLAWRRPRAGGTLMLVAPLTAAALSTVVPELGPAVVAGAAVGVLPGVLFLLSAHYSERGAPPPPATRPGHHRTPARARPLRAAADS